MSTIFSELPLLETGSSILTPIAIIGASAINAGVAWRNTNANIKAQKEREERLEVLQERHRYEDKLFQIDRDKRNERFQLEVEARKMAFEEQLELRRLQFQVKMEQQREEFQEALLSRQFEHNKEIAQFQVQAMRETQILVARENAQKMLENHMVIEALSNFPLNISPIVLLNNRPHTLSSLLRFTVGENATKDVENNKLKLLTVTPMDVMQDVINYAEHPEALNIFIAPVFVDSKLSYKKTLSTKIWEATYQKIESFFTKNYSRDSRTPVVFYPTAWNDKYTSGVHASETLHFFLKDMPCIVLEPKFDGNRFRMAVSSWGLGYGSTEHNRIEYEFDINIDLEIAKAVYERSSKALIPLRSISALLKRPDLDKYAKLEHVLEQNVAFYEVLEIGKIISGEFDELDRLQRLKQISALGINNIFSIDDSQDLEPLANYFAARIGVTLTMLSDIHHLVATSAFPKLPRLMEEGNFNEIYANKSICIELFNNYKTALAIIRDEECSFADEVEAKRISLSRHIEKINIRNSLGVTEEIPDESWESIVRDYVKTLFHYENDDFDTVWSRFVLNIRSEDIGFAHSLLSIISDEEKREQLDEKIEK